MSGQPLALVAGGSGAIGAAVSQALARDGFDVALTYRSNESAAQEAAQRVAAAGGSASVLALDLCDAERAAAVVASLPAVDAVVYAAGPYIPMRYVSALEAATFRDQLLGDAAACFNLFRPALPRLRETRGCAVAVVTPAIKRYAARDVLSAAPKAAVQQLVRAIAAEEGKYGVRANCVGVGLLEAGLFDELLASGDYTEEMLDVARRSIAMRCFGTAEDVAEAVAFLVSRRARWITGQTLDVDGGYSV